MKNVVVCLLLVNMLLIYSTEFGVCDETTKTLPKLWTKSILFWEWVIYILQNFHQPPESLLCFRTIALENLLSLLCTNQRILCSAKRWIVIMVVHTTSSNDTVSLSLFKLVSFGICVFMNTSHTHSYTKDVFFRNTDSMDATSFTKCVDVCMRKANTQKNELMTVGTFNGNRKRNIHSSTKTTTTKATMSSRWKWCSLSISVLIRGTALFVGFVIK